MAFVTELSREMRQFSKLSQIETSALDLKVHIDLSFIRVIVSLDLHLFFFFSYTRDHILLPRLRSLLFHFNRIHQE